MGKVSRIRFAENRDSQGVNRGYTAYLGKTIIAEVTGSSRHGFHTIVTGYGEEFSTKTLLQAEIRLAKIFNEPIKEDQEGIELLRRAFGDKDQLNDENQ